MRRLKFPIAVLAITAAAAGVWTSTAAAGPLDPLTEGPLAPVAEPLAPVLDPLAPVLEPVLAPAGPVLGQLPSLTDPGSLPTGALDPVLAQLSALGIDVDAGLDAGVDVGLDVPLVPLGATVCADVDIAPNAVLALLPITSIAVDGAVGLEVALALNSAGCATGPVPTDVAGVSVVASPATPAAATQAAPTLAG